jgi:hypothetical protein
MQNELDRDQKAVAQEEEPSRSSSVLATKEGRMNVYSCVFCEFVQGNLSELDDDPQDRTSEDLAFEAKYLYHLRTVHSLEQ